MRNRIFVICLLGLLLSAAALAGKTVDNKDNSLDGLYLAETAKNRTTGEVHKNVTIDIEGKYISVRLPENKKVSLRAIEWYDWGYQMELTARQQEGDDMWIIKYKNVRKIH